MSEIAHKFHNFVICINNKDYSTSLVIRKIYEALTDADAEQNNQIRVIDESGEDYLYPQEFFIPIELPKNAEDAIIQAA
jgi:signal recognition particle receptor subunit beta